MSGPLMLNTGGPSYTIKRLCNQLAEEFKVSIKFIGSDIDEGVEWNSNLIDYYQIPATKYPFTFRPYINLPEDILDDVDLIHSHGLWHRSNNVAGILAKNKIHIITPRGMLTKWAFSYNKWKKQVAWSSFQKKVLCNASCLHATSQEEASDLREKGLTKPIVIIPNGIDIPVNIPESPRSILEDKWPVLKGKKIILFMSRIHKKKGLDMLASIWGDLSCRYPDWHLVIAGTDKDNHWKDIVKILKENNAINSTLFVGLQQGSLKEALIAACEFSILPTYSENFGVAIGESLAYCKPVITTTGSPWSEIVTHKCGWWVSPKSNEISEALKDALNTDNCVLQQMGQRGNELIQDKYSWDSVTKKIYRTYKWLLGETEKPEFVF